GVASARVSESWRRGAVRPFLTESLRPTGGCGAAAEEGPVRHRHLANRRAGTTRLVRHEAGRPGRYSRGVLANSDQCVGNSDLRAAADDGEAGASLHYRPFDDARPGG